MVGVFSLSEEKPVGGSYYPVRGDPSGSGRRRDLRVTWSVPLGMAASEKFVLRIAEEQASGEEDGRRGGRAERGRGSEVVFKVGRGRPREGRGYSSYYYTCMSSMQELAMGLRYLSFQNDLTEGLITETSGTSEK